MLLLTLLDYLGTFAFAVSGALKAVRKEMDLFGLIVLAVVTAIGGGTIRDVMLGVRPFWFTNPNYILLSLLAALAVFALYRFVSAHETALLWFDAVGLGAFTVIGASHGMEHGLGLAGTVVLACLTGIGGGLIRDVLAADIPVVLRKEVYASATILGAVIYWLMRRYGVPLGFATPVAMVIVTAVRLLSLHYGVGLPKLRAKAGEEAE
jgi:uncharacterized membrane protein YeiH